MKGEEGGRERGEDGGRGNQKKRKVIPIGDQQRYLIGYLLRLQEAGVYLHVVREGGTEKGEFVKN